ncbi:uncharacterized protein [Linepithema humile]|uniref:uncharacterized protein isoform X2 n=1 Tax=Linepithema humile TaxID=83485 RepID=UPI00351E448C
MSSGSSLKCGYCDYILHGSCGNALAHHCFSDFSEHLHAINVDENSVVTMLQRYDSDAEEMEDAANNMSEAIFGTNNPKQTVDELLIDLVHERAITDVQSGKQKWKHLRDAYIKARKRMQGYVQSGSGAEAGHPLKSTFAHYGKMRFLDDILNTVSTVNSLPEFVQNSSHSSNSGVHEDVSLDVSMSYPENDDDRTDITTDTERPQSATSNVSTSANKNKKAKKAQLQDAFLEMLKTAPQQQRDVVDSFVEQLADILRRLPYPKRRSLQRRLMDLAIEEEEMMEAQQGLN